MACYNVKTKNPTTGVKEEYEIYAQSIVHVIIELRKKYGYGESDSEDIIYSITRNKPKTKLDKQHKRDKENIKAGILLTILAELTILAVVCLIGMILYGG